MNRRKGFIMLVALLSLALLGAAIAALSGAVGDDSRRTTQQLRGAQLDQLILAGIRQVKSHLASGSPHAGDNWSVDLPSILAQNCALRASVDSEAASDQAVIRIAARVDSRHATQLVHLRRQGGAWELLSIEPAPE